MVLVLLLMATFTVLNVALIGLMTISYGRIPLPLQATSLGHVHPAVSSSGSRSNRTSYFLFILILSSIRGWERRSTLRETWISDVQRTEGVGYRFVIGIDNISDATALSLLELENKVFNDLLLLPNLVDQYNTLTSKVLKSLVWLDTHYEFSYLLKGDDDTFVVLTPFLDELRSRNKMKTTPATDLFYWGFIYESSPVIKKGKNSEDGWDLCDHYLPYASGGGYVLSATLVHLIASSAKVLRIYKSEDVSVGVWLTAYKVERKHDKRFNVLGSGCSSSEILAHWLKPSDIKKRYLGLRMLGDQCANITGSDPNTQ